MPEEIDNSDTPTVMKDLVVAAMGVDDKDVALKLKVKLDKEMPPFDLVSAFTRYVEIIEKPTIFDMMRPNREKFLITMLGAVDVFREQVDAGEFPKVAFSQSLTLDKIYHLRSVRAKMENVMNLSKRLLHDLPNVSSLEGKLTYILDEVNKEEKATFSEWSELILRGIRKETLTLKLDDPVIVFGEGNRQMEVTYNPELSRICQETQQLLILGFRPATEIIDLVVEAKKFVRQAMELDQIATFHNTIGDRMIPSQMPMMLDMAVKMSKMVQEQNAVSWKNIAEVNAYIENLKKIVTDMARQNSHLGRIHIAISSKVMTLFKTDLIKQQQKWKETVKEIREIIVNVEREGYKNMKGWQNHWDHQLYKALEMRYLYSLRSLNENLPEITVELVYRQERIQFKPPLEELRNTYYTNVKRFLNIPLNFRGVVDRTDLFFEQIVYRQTARLRRIYIQGENLFKRIVSCQEKFKGWVKLGSMDADYMRNNVLKTAEDWDTQFRISKQNGQDIVSMKVADEKIGCFIMNYKLFRLEIELLNRKNWDIMVTLLNNSIVEDLTTLQSFLIAGITKLNEDPESVEDIIQANEIKEELSAQVIPMQEMMDACEKKDKTLFLWTKERFDMEDARTQLDEFNTLLENFQHHIGNQVEVFKINLRNQAQMLNIEMENFKLRWDELKPKDTEITTNPQKFDEAIVYINFFRSEWSDLLERKEKLSTSCEALFLEDVEFPIAMEMEEDISSFEETWTQISDFRNAFKEFETEDWIVFRAKPYRFEEFLQEWEEKFRNIPKSDFIIQILRDIEEYKTIIPNLKYIRGDIFTEKHWYELFSLLEIPSKHLSELKLRDFLYARDKVNENIKDLKELNARASGEVIVRQALNELDSWEIEARFQLAENQDSQERTIYIIEDFKSVLNKLGDNQSLLQSIRTSPFYSHFADRISMWETKLADLDEYIQSLNKIQRRWIYLEPIFSHGVLESEQQRFRRIDDDFRLIMDSINKDKRVSNLCKQSGIRNRLNMLIDQLSRCQNSLNEFLEKKRSGFPRFYFIGDDDLLEILGQSTKPSVIQAHLKKLFAGIYNVNFDENHQFIIAMKSLEGEIVPLKSFVKITPKVEEWLSELSNEMKYTLKSLLLDCVADSKHDSRNPDKYPTQILCLSNSIVFTDQCEEAIRSGRLTGLLTQLRQDLDMYTSIRIEEDNANAKVLELKLKDLILDIIHNIDVVEYLMQRKIKSVTDWHWQKQLRFYIRDDGVAIIKMADAEFTYSYEYQGNAQKLVHTPLTDKCYLTLTQGMRMGLGGNPYGPAGTGKTESVKALGCILGRQVLVFNCDEGIDLKSMGRIFMGLVKCGAWGCFDEFNRLEGVTLSAVSMQIQPIQTALKQGSPNVMLMDEVIPLDSNAGIFVTLNPAGQGYGGRNKLPDNLKQLFRPVVMSQPDNERIAEVILYTEGYKFAKTLGKKLVQIFKLSEKLLTRQTHYDWGLRALKTVLKGCGNALKEFKKEKNSVPEKEESDIVVSTLRLNTLPKLTYSDCFRFDSLIKDVFPTATFKDLGYHELGENVREVYKQFNLQVNENQVRKCLELYEQLQQRMGVVIVGPPCCGKSTILNILKNALLRMGENVKTHVLNPKAMPRSSLLGHINLDTRQWTDGVLTMKAQQVYSEPPDVTSWIICDGDIDPEWIESLNSVLDDNRLLTLPSGWRIKFGPNVNFIFETHDLSLASPATISRMGMIFMSEEDADIKGIVTSWVSLQPPDSQVMLQQFLDDYLEKGLHYLSGIQDPLIQLSQVSIVQNVLSLMHNIKSTPQMAITLIRGIGGHLSSTHLLELSAKVLSWMHLPSIEENRLNLSYNEKMDRVEPYRDDAMDPQEEFQFNSLPLVKTADVKRILNHISPWLEEQESFMLIGPEGCGKTMILDYAFKQLRSTEVAMIHCSSLISPENVLQKMSQVCITMSTNAGRVYKSKDGERLILYFKDINLVKPDKWGTCQLVEFLRQIIVYQGFYDKSLEWVTVQGIQIVASITVGNSGGRYDLSPRFTSRIRICSMNQPEPDQLFTICHSYLSTLLVSNFPDHHISKNAKKIESFATGMVKVYTEVRQTFTPIIHSHYQFTPRDLTKWTLGLMRYDILEDVEEEDEEDLTEELIGFYQVWAYEASRIFQDKLVSPQEKLQFWDAILLPVVYQWSLADEKRFDQGRARGFATFKLEFTLNTCVHISQAMTWMSSLALSAIHPGVRDPASLLLGPKLCEITNGELNAIVDKGIVAFGRENRELNVVSIGEILLNVAHLDRILSYPCSSLVLAGRAGVGRRTALSIVSALHKANIVTLKVGRNYDVKSFKADLKGAIQMSAIEGNKVFFVVEDFQLVDINFLDMLNSLLSSGEIPGLYTPDELEIIISSLREVASAEGYTSSLYSFFALRVRRMMHVILIMDHTNENFIKNCQSNPALYKQCSLIWLDVWSDFTLNSLPKDIIKKFYNFPDGELCGYNASYPDGERRLKFTIGFKIIYESMNKQNSYPRRFVSLIHNHALLYNARRRRIFQQAEKFRAGISKLEEARDVVEKLKLEATEQEKVLAEKQAEANKALEMITTTIQHANVQRSEMEIMKAHALKETDVLAERKKEIDAELQEIEPLINSARASVGNIKNESISEIRSLRAPPDIIRDILEGVLRLMGIRDMSWNSMKTFLSKRGVKEEIRTFDARTIEKSDREAVESLLKIKCESFEPKNAKRASAAAAPLASWVVANVKFAKVIEKIQPLEAEEQMLAKNLLEATTAICDIEDELTDVSDRVSILKERLNSNTKEAASIEFHLNKAITTLNSAEGLVEKLNDEFTRWKFELQKLDEELKDLPLDALMASSFITYLCNAPEDVRTKYLEYWSEKFGREITFDFRKFLSTERDLLNWQYLGLPSDRLSQENAIMIIQTCLRPYLVDPSSRATEWLINYFTTIREPVVISLHDSKFTNELELAVRFGKILIIVEADFIEPILIPILRGDLVSQGSREVIPVGNKMVDYNPDFRLFLATRNPYPDIPPDAQAVLAVVNFTTTRAGLTSQLLTSTLSFEKPQIQAKKSELVKKIESLKMQMEQVGDSLLQGLASAQGNILENKELLESLNQTKASSSEISNSLKESSAVEETLNKEIDVYRPFAEFGSKLYFAIVEVAQLNPMYQFSLSSFYNIFEKTVQAAQKASTSSVEQRIDVLKHYLLDIIYDHVCGALFKSDRMAFAMHIAHRMYPKAFQKHEWDAFIGHLVGNTKTAESDFSAPSWIAEDRHFAVDILMSTFPDLYKDLELSNEGLWKDFYNSSECEIAFPLQVQQKLTPFEEVMLINALRPDRLHTSMYNFSRKALSKKSLFPQPPTLRSVYKQSDALEPILLLVSSGADPSQEVRELAEEIVGLEKYTEISMGQGQVDAALIKLRQASEVGHWICMKNLHLVTHLLDILEKEIRSIYKPNGSYRLWLTSEPHSAFPKVLAESCLKIAYEAPQGVKKNLQRTFDGWSIEYFTGDKNILRCQSLFVLAVFHAIVQERRTYIPQGWSTFYEFNESDLRAGADVIEQFFKSRSKEIQWSYIQGLFENAIYGGRVDNDYDNRVLVSYLTDYFHESILTGGNPSRKKFGPNVTLPSTTNAQDYLRVIEGIPENDKPFFFGLPSNIEKSWQRTTSMQVINQLKNLSRDSGDKVVYDKNIWIRDLSPILNLWRKLHAANNSMSIMLEKFAAPVFSKQEETADPIEGFLTLEYYNIVVFMKAIHKCLGGFSKVIRGIAVPSEEMIVVADTLMKREIPLEWRKTWEGPQDAQKYLTGLVNRAASVKKWSHRAASGDLLNHPIDLSDLLNPDTYFCAFKQYCARKLGVSMDELKFVCAWDRNTLGSNKLTCQLTGLLLEGCTFSGGRLQENESEDLPVSRIVDCTIAWVAQKQDVPSRGAVISVPLYANEMRKKLIGSLEMPANGDDSKWIKTGIALFLKT